ncbi:MAG: hypothetical protein ABSE49_05250 [Polyangiaceae bacterium]|jgi:hypothetical protein
MFASAFDLPRRFFPAFLAACPLLLAHCAAPATWTDPNNADPAAELEVAQPIDASGHVAENPVGQPVSVQVTMIQTGPGTCQSCGVGGCGSVGNSTETPDCSGPDTPLDFQLSAVGCDQNLCDVVGIHHGDPATGDTVTIVPHAGFVTVNATGTSGSLVASGSVQVFANCTNAPDAPNCQ